MRKIFVARHPTEAHLLRGVLESEGIPSEVRREALFGASGDLPVFDALPEIWILNDEQASAALAVLRRLGTSAEPEGQTWTCANCGEPQQPQFTACWRCMAERHATA